MSKVRKGQGQSDLSEGQLRFVEKICAELQNKLVFAKWAEVRVKNKTTRRIVAVTSYMMIIIKQSRNKSSVFTPKKKKPKYAGILRLKLVKRYHLLALRSISVFKNNKKQLELQFYKKSPLVFLTPLVGEFIRQIRIAIRLFTYGFPNNRLPGIFGMNDGELLPLPPCKPSDFGPAHGFLHTFSAFSCFYNQSISNEVMRYVTDLHEAGVVEFRLQDCPGIEPKGEIAFSIEPISAALRYNTYFKAISAVHLLKKDILFSICNVLRYNTKVSKITLSQFSEGNIIELGEALQYNRNNAVQMIDLSGTHITRGVTIFSQTLQSFPHCLKVLSLNDCNLDGKQLAMIAESLSSNYGMSLTIEELDLSNNKFDEQASIAFETWLSKAAEYSRLQVLRLANTNQSFSTVATYFHFLSDLQELDLSYSKLDTRAVQVLCSSLEKSSTLKRLDVSYCNLSNGHAAAIIQAFTSNKKLQKTHLSISSCELTEADAETLAKALSLNINCHTLNMSRNKLKEKGLIGVLQSIVLSATRSLDAIILDQTYKNAYLGERVSSALMSVSNSLTCVKSISIAGGYGSVAIPFLKYLEGNTSLLELDISNNYMGDAAASAISDMLRNNSTLLRLKCDGNNISPSGWKMILASFMHNRTLVEMDFPWDDYARYSSLPKDKLAELRAVLIDIQRALQTNHSEDGLMDRLNPPPMRPLPTFVHPAANLPDKLAIGPNSELSSLAAQKINVERKDEEEVAAPCLFDEDFDGIISDSSTQSDFDEKGEGDAQGAGVKEWFTDSESFSDDDYQQDYLTPSPPTRAPITLATLNGHVVPVPAREKSVSEKDDFSERDDEESMMSSDSDFDI